MSSKVKLTKTAEAEEKNGEIKTERIKRKTCLM